MVDLSPTTCPNCVGGFKDNDVCPTCLGCSSLPPLGAQAAVFKKLLKIEKLLSVKPVPIPVSITP